jgi:hypothetical protein
MGMILKYTLEILDTVKSANSLKVNLTFDDHWEADTFSDLTDHDIIEEMHEWCQENECGWRTSYNTFKFRNKEQLLMFVMRWA